jgi:hypothetical protein
MPCAAYQPRDAERGVLYRVVEASENEENEEGFFVSSRDSAMREKGALNEAARRRSPATPAMGIDRAR